jgi:hypothetical protein
VSDGALVSRLPAFVITVMQDANGSVSISWDPPATNTDGTPTETLTGYKVFYGLASRQYTSSLPGDESRSHVGDDRAARARDLVFRGQSRQQRGLESDYSSEVSKNVQ